MRALSIAFSLAASVVLLVSGCGLKQEYRRVTDQLDTLEIGQRRTEARVRQIDSLSKRQMEILYQLNADLDLRLKRIEEQLLISAQQREDLDSRRMEMGLSLGASRPDTAARKAAAKAELDPKTLYDTAYLDITRGHYDLAIMGFAEFIRNYSQHSLADNAQYWIGEAYYAQNKFPQALAEFQKVVDNYPKQDKVPAAMYKVGLCHQKLGDGSKASEVWKELIAKYPKSNEAALARERLKE